MPPEDEISPDHSGPPGPRDSAIRDFLNFCRIEKGLSANSLDAYSRDLLKWKTFFSGSGIADIADRASLLLYLNALYRSGLEARSIARHLATLRNFYRFLLAEGTIAPDPTEHIQTPKQWTTIPHY
ncbi:MAG: site-specific integrase, partial [Acidobacteriota bacterium]|nr:site-specific integrase [Acidobacteriota bacterium]